ncbi:MAG TPA: GNAT family N-acetyltransferase [Streptosporangiaceae bacterium]|nr:GNAT family N-acetyltransferase [Streptosporangiaceae bacterium]
MAVKDSFLAGSREMCAEEGSATDWLDLAAADFGALVAARSAIRRMWGVPVTELWYVDADRYIGTVMIRHELTRELRYDGGHIGYHVVPGERRRGHATAMLAGACHWCKDLGLSRVLVTCDAGNLGSRRVIEANAGVLESSSGGILRYWIDL